VRREERGERREEEQEKGGQEERERKEIDGWGLIDCIKLWKLDYVFSLCEKYGIFMILVFLDSADFTNGNQYFAQSPFSILFPPSFHSFYF
jgi:hypothetical protein